MAAQQREQPPLAQHDSSVLDLAFVMDCTGSMGSYISSAQKNIRKIVEDIVANEKSDVALALVEYRDHPPQDSTFVTRPHDFTSSVGTMKSWLEACSAEGGGDAPEAVADGLHQLLKLSWRADATKIAVLIADAPPHGLGGRGDGFPNGSPSGIDPMEVTAQLAEKGVTLYVVGCEPSIVPYKDFFMGIAYMTGGQYVPLAGAKSLSQVIIGGAQEELSLERWMEEVNKEVEAEVQAKGAQNFSDEDMSKKLMSVFKSRGAVAKQLKRNDASLGGVSEMAKNVSKMSNLADYRSSAPTHGPPPPPPGRSSMFNSIRPDVCDAPAMAYASPHPTSAPMMAAAPMTSASAGDVYNCEEDEIQTEQVMRMVQKSKMRNQSWFS